MRKIDYIISDSLHEQLKEDFKKEGENCHIYRKALPSLRIFLNKIPNAQMLLGTKGGDLTVQNESLDAPNEKKGTEANTITFNQLKVSSQA
ncbi:hypothetical protein GCM10028808_39240 [Spirosoma migulaei]